MVRTRITIATKSRNDEARVHEEQQLSNANGYLRKLQLQELELWSDVYRLATAAFPELPSQALESCKAIDDKTLSLSDAHAATLSLCYPHAARHLAPIRQFDMYEGPGGEPSPVIISSAGRDSRNDVTFSVLFTAARTCA